MRPTNNTLRLGIVGAAMLVVCLVLPAGQARAGLGVRDMQELNATALRSPSEPARIGARWFELEYEFDPAGPIPKPVLFLAESTYELRVDRLLAHTGAFPSSPTRLDKPETIHTIQTAPFIARARFRLPNDGVVGQGVTQRRISDNSSGLYRWALEFDFENGTVERRIGSLHAYTVPRRVVIAVVGDSYASGEGAPQINKPHWISEYEGVAAHRSALSGFELAAQETRQRLHDEGILAEIINVTSSGAILSDIYSTTSQAKRTRGHEAADLVYTSEPQLDRVAGFLAAGGRTGQPAMDTVDVLLMSGGGNDFGFGAILENYLSPFPPFLGLWTSGMGWNVKWGNIPPRNATFVFDYAQIIRDEYTKFGEALGQIPVGTKRRPPAPGDSTVKFRRVLVTDYPNLFNVPPHTYISGYFDWHYVIPLRLHSFQLLDVNLMLFPQLTDAVHTAVGQLHASNAAGANWTLIETNPHMTPNNSVGGFDRYFVTRGEASWGMPGPHHETNAFHPNRKGHRMIYREALKPELDTWLTTSQLAAQAQAEGYAQPEFTNVDLQISLETHTYDVSTRKLSVAFTIYNAGHATAPAGTQVEILEASAGTQLSSVVLNRALPAEASLSYSIQSTLPELPEAVSPIYEFTPGPTFNPATFATRDRVLSWYFPRGYRFRVRLHNPSDNNPANNEALTASVAVPPILSDTERHHAIRTLMASGWMPNVNHPAQATPANLDLQNANVLAYFGYCDPAIGWTEPTNNISITADELGIYAHMLHTGDLGLSKLVPSYQPQCPPYLRVLRYVQPPVAPPGDKKSGLSWFDATAVDPLETELVDAAPRIAASPPDGRPFSAEFDLRRPGAPPIVQPFAGILPTEMPHILAPSPAAPLNSDALHIAFGDLGPHVGGYDLRVGTSPMGAQLYSQHFNARVLSNLATEPNANMFGPELVSVHGIPQDGREVFVSMVAELDGIGRRAATMAYRTAALNARLVEPAEGEPVESGPVVFRWKEPVDTGEGVSGYRILVGSLPGEGDIYGDSGALLGQAEWLGADALEFALPALAIDNRILYVTLQTLRGETIASETYEFEPTGHTLGGLLHPRSLRAPLVPGVPLPLAIADGATYRASLWSAPQGGELLYDSGWLEADKHGAVLTPTMPSFGQAQPRVYLSLETESQSGSAQQTFPFEPYRGAFLAGPSPLADSPLSNETTLFTIQPGPGAIEHRLIIGSASGDSDLFDTGWLDSNNTQIPVNLAALDSSELLHISVLSRFALGATPQADGITYAFPRPTQ